MLRRFSANYMLLLYITDLVCGIVALWLAHDLRPTMALTTPISPEGARVPPMVYELVLVVFAIVLPLVGLYDPQRVFRAIDEATLSVSGVTASGLILAGVLYLTYREVSRLTFLIFLVLAIAMFLAYRAVLRLAYRVLLWPTQLPVKVLIAGAGQAAAQAARILTSAGVAVCGFVGDDSSTPGTPVEGVPMLGRLDDLPQLVRTGGITDVILALPGHLQDRSANLLVALWELPLRLYTIPDLFDLGFARARVQYLGGLTMIGLREPLIDGFQRVAKRLLDLILGSLLLLCFLPVLAMVAVAVRLDSPGPIIFRQQRVGENGRQFTMYKFRTMIPRAEDMQADVNTYTVDGKLIHKRADDPRVTRVGRFLRHFSLDELPQLFNVLRGEMSLVGPRPELPWIVAQYKPWQRQRLAVPPGMTSWYVVNGRSEVPMHLNTAEDLRYIQHYSLLQDLRILWKSVGAVLRGRGAF